MPNYIPRFTLYGVRHKGLSVHDLIHLQVDAGGLFANAEHSGSEGCYVEVARWSHERNRWERFCFHKCLEGEVTGDFTAKARDIAEDINNAGCAWRPPFVHNLPNYEGDNVVAEVRPTQD